ncbi:MAG: hypothetical protein AB8E82_11745 [Aureispira sp.]
MHYFKKIMLVLALSWIAHATVAQSSYKTGIGLRLGPTYGFTVKHFINNKLAFEGLVSSRYYGSNSNGWNRNRGATFTGLLEWHFPIGNIQGFNWFVGGGLHLGVLEGYNNHPVYYDNRLYLMIGLDAIGGIEYTLPNAPITFQADVKPSIHIIEYVGVWWDEIALSVRYTFK